MRILITNDDGYQSPQLRILCQILDSEHDVYLVAPEREQSGISQAISIYNSLTCRPLKEWDFPAYSITGTPSDCMKFAVCTLLKDVGFQLVVSGINPGENAGLSSLYSGTVAGAREGATWSIPSIALSVWDGSPERSLHAGKWLLDLLKNDRTRDMKPGSFWNVNFPKCHPEAIRGIGVCNMSRAVFRDRYLEMKIPRGTSEFWLDGFKHEEQFKAGSDDYALKNDRIAITPLQIDQSSDMEIKRLKSWFPREFDS